LRTNHYTDDDFPCPAVSAYYGPSDAEETFVTCDFCEVVWGCEGSEFAVVGGMADDGWITMGKMDFCPECCGGEVV
jgi:hypothetical protein